MAEGRWNGPGGGGTGGNATADKIVAPYSAFVDGEEIIGVLTDHGTIVFIPTSSDQGIPDGVYKDAVIKGAKIAAGNAAAAQVLAGYTFSNESGVNLSGAMANRNSQVITPSASQQTFQAGYYSGITCNAIASATYKRIAIGSKPLNGVSSVSVSGLAFKPSRVYVEALPHTSGGTIQTASGFASDYSGTYVIGVYPSTTSAISVYTTQISFTNDGFVFNPPININSALTSASYVAVE